MEYTWRARDSTSIIDCVLANNNITQQIQDNLVNIGVNLYSDYYLPLTKIATFTDENKKPFK